MGASETVLLVNIDYICRVSFPLQFGPRLNCNSFTKKYNEIP